MKNKLIVILAILSVVCSCLFCLTACDEKGGTQTATNGLHYQRISGKNEYRVIGLGTASELDIVILDTYNGMPVTEIDEKAFFGEKNGCANIESVVVPDSVTTIGKSAFEGCLNLKSITLSKYLTKIDNSTFKNCTALSTVKINEKVTKIGERAFENCDSIESLTIPDSVETIGASAFSSCDNLKTVSIGKKVNQIGDSAFFYCKSLKSFSVSQENEVYCALDGVLYTKGLKTLVQYALGKDDHTFRVPEGVEIIAKRAFYRANWLYFIDLPNTVSVIEDGAMSYCDNLQNVALSQNLTLVGNGVFSSSPNLTDVFYKGSPSTWNKFVYGSDWENFIVKVSVYFYSEGIPQFQGKYWYYDQGYPTKWK